MQNEERYPLLLVFAEENGGGTSERGSYREPRRVFLERGRTIASGANTVFSKWPGHLTACWAILILFLATVGLMLALALVTAAIGHLALTTNEAFLKHSLECQLNRTKREINNTYLVHLVHTRREWSKNQLQLVEEIAHNFRNADILVLNFNKKPRGNLSLRKATTTTTTRTTELDETTYENSNFERHLASDLHFFNINIGSRKLLKYFLSRRNYRNISLTKPPENKTEDDGEEKATKQSLLEIQADHPNVRIINTTLPKYFKGTFLESTWMVLDDNLLELAVRVQQLWQAGGASFKIPADDPAKVWDEREDVAQIKSLAEKGGTSFQQLPEGLVTVDEDGLHMETKTSCHAFFGEILTNLKTTHAGASETSLLRKGIVTFCRRGAVDSAYCHKILT